jgi:hypothetical protein
MQTTDCCLSSHCPPFLPPRLPFLCVPSSRHLPACLQYPPYGYPPYGYYPHPHGHQYMYAQPPAAPGLPPLPRHQQVLQQQQQAEAELGAELGSSNVELVVRGSNRPFAALTAAAAANRHAGASSAAAAMEVEGQEQVNILNLPLPEIEAQAGEGSAHGAAAAVADLEPAQLKEAEVQVMQLEKELGTSHPEVRKRAGLGQLHVLISRWSCRRCAGAAQGLLASSQIPHRFQNPTAVLACVALNLPPRPLFPACSCCCRLARPTSPCPASTWQAWRRAAPSSWQWRHSAGRLKS